VTGTQAGIRVAHSESRGTILAGGIALVGGAVAFLPVFSYLAARFHYPDVLDGSAHDVLPALLATRTAGRAAWAIDGVLPLVFIPAGVGALEADRRMPADVDEQPPRHHRDRGRQASRCSINRIVMR
jgi:hypothetical protein